MEIEIFSKEKKTYPVCADCSNLAESVGLATGVQSRGSANIDEAILASIPPNTIKAYRSDIRYISAWLVAMGHNFHQPLSSDWVELFIIDHLEIKSEKAKEAELRLIEKGFKAFPGPHSLATIQRRLAALSNYCKSKGWENPVRSERVQFLLSRLSKMHASTKQPKAITRNSLINVLAQTGSDIIGMRDRALLSFIFASGGRRRGEAENARIEDLEDLGDCYLFHMQRSKTNKSGKSEPKPVQGIAAKYLREWLATLGEKEGPLFRPVTKSGIIKPRPLGGAFISRVVKKLISKAGLDPKEFSAHSLRSGFITQAAREGCSMPEIKALTGHRSDAMVSRYFQQGNVLRSKAGSLL